MARLRGLLRLTLLLLAVAATVATPFTSTQVTAANLAFYEGVNNGLTAEQVGQMVLRRARDWSHEPGAVLQAAGARDASVSRGRRVRGGHCAHQPRLGRRGGADRVRRSRLRPSADLDGDGDVDENDERLEAEAEAEEEPRTGHRAAHF